MNTEQLVQLIPGLEVYFRGCQGKIDSIFDTIIMVNVDGFTITVDETNAQHLFFSDDEQIKKDLYRMATTFFTAMENFYSTKIGPIHPQITKEILRYWTLLGNAIVNKERSSLYADVKGNFLLFVSALGSAKQTAKQLNVLGIPYFTEKETVVDERWIENFLKQI